MWVQVSYRSRVKTYAVCKLEGLAINFGIAKCRHYLAGMPFFTAYTAHRTLVNVFDKGIADVLNP